MERRITNSEANLVGVMNYIRQEDINYKPMLAQAVVSTLESPKKAEDLYQPYSYK